MRFLVNMKNWGGGGGRPYASSSSDGFLHLEIDHGLIDVGCAGPRFTWSNDRSGFHHIRERLDKGLANWEWSTLFPCALIRVLPRFASDHASIFLNTSRAMGAGPKPFPFENCWVRDDESKVVVQRAWSKAVVGSASFRLVRRISATKDALKI